MAVAADRIAVVTGASSGIGHAIAARLLADGWSVVGLSRREPDLTRDGLRWRPCDLAEPGSIGAAVHGVPVVDAVVHAAGFQVSAALADLDPDDGDAMYAVHVGAAVRLGHELVHRIPDGGRVVLVGSRTASGVPGKSLYAGTKAALRGLARSWAGELAPRGITVNVVEPGSTDTAMLADPRRAATPPVLPPLGRRIRPDEVAAVVAFLVGDGGAMVTGQCWAICGGASLGGPP